MDYKCQVNQEQIVKGGLLHAIKYHCKIDFDFDQNTDIFDVISPFRKENIHGFTFTIKQYDFNEIHINKLGSYYK